VQLQQPTALTAIGVSVHDLFGGARDGIIMHAEHGRWAGYMPGINRTAEARLTILAQCSRSGYSATLIQEFDARLANRPLLVYGFRSLWLSWLSARVPESKKKQLKMVG